MRTRSLLLACLISTEQYTITVGLGSYQCSYHASISYDYDFVLEIFQFGRTPISDTSICLSTHAALEQLIIGLLNPPRSELGITEKEGYLRHPFPSSGAFPTFNPHYTIVAYSNHGQMCPWLVRGTK